MPTVHELRNAIRVAVDRFERPGSTPFTKETLVAVCEAVEADVETTPTPPRPEMRAAILRATGADPEATPADADSAFRKPQLVAIADALGAEDA